MNPVLQDQEDNNHQQEIKSLRENFCKLLKPKFKIKNNKKNKHEL